MILQALPYVGALVVFYVGLSALIGWVANQGYMWGEIALLVMIVGVLAATFIVVALVSCRA